MCSLFSSWILRLAIFHIYPTPPLLTLCTYLKWTIQGLFSCSTPPVPATFSHLIPCPHSQSPIGIGVFGISDGVVVVASTTGGGKVLLDPSSLASWQVRHFSLVSTQFPFPSSFGFSTIVRSLQPQTVLGRMSRRGRRRMAGMERRGVQPCITKCRLATAACSVCHPEILAELELPENALALRRPSSGQVTVFSKVFKMVHCYKCLLCISLNKTRIWLRSRSEALKRWVFIKSAMLRKFSWSIENWFKFLYQDTG